MFFVLCVLLMAWQSLALVADLRVMGRGVQEWLMLPLSLGNVMVLLTPLNSLFILLSDRLGAFSLSSVIVISVANALLVLSPYWLLKQRWRWLVWIPLTLFTLWCLMQLCYCRAYDDLMPWQSLTLTDNVNSTLMNSTLSLLRWHDLFVFLPFLLLVLYDLFSRGEKRGTNQRWRPFVKTILACLVLSLLGYVGGHQNYENRYLHNFSNRGYFGQNGFIPYCVFTLYQIVFNSNSVSDEERAMVERFLDEDCPHYTDNRFAAGDNPNLVLIIVESLHSWPIGMQVDGRAVTPALDSLLAGEGVIYAPHVLFQTSHGHSSDAHFIYNTGLLPLRDAAVAVSWGNGPYPTLAEALEGYDCREVICTPGMNWNQSVTARTYGFDTLYTRDHMNEAGVLHRHHNVDDAALTDFASGLLPQLHQPFFLEMVTMTMHAPYPADKVRHTWILDSDTLNAEARGYLNCVNLTDSCIGAFIHDLHKQGLDENTVVAIVSDHTQIYLSRVMGKPDSEFAPNDWGIPLIIAGADTTLRYEPVIGQVDVFPTLLDVMGTNEYYWKGLGHSILRFPVTSAIQHRNMSVIGDSTALTPHQLKAWEISRLLIFDKDNSKSKLKHERL